jgi:hypothetical protein
MIVNPTLHENSHALYGCHGHVVRECHRCNVATQHENKFRHFVYTTSYIRIFMFDVKLDEFDIPNKNITTYLTKYLFCHTIVMSYICCQLEHVFLLLLVSLHCITLSCIYLVV